jgi:hypothetical protein
MKAVYCESEDENFAGDVLVTWVKNDELESDAVLRAMELCGMNNNYFVKEAGYNE